MGRWRYKAYARNGVTCPGDDFVDLVAGELTAFARLRALGHFDLEFVGVDQIIRGDAETPAGHLLDGTAAGGAGGVWGESRFVFSPFTGIRHAPEAVHGDGEGLVSFSADGAEAHGSGGEAL